MQEDILEKVLNDFGERRYARSVMLSLLKKKKMTSAIEVLQVCPESKGRNRMAGKGDADGRDHTT